MALALKNANALRRGMQIITTNNNTFSRTHSLAFSQQNQNQWQWQPQLSPIHFSHLLLLLLIDPPLLGLHHDHKSIFVVLLSDRTVMDMLHFLQWWISTRFVKFCLTGQFHCHFSKLSFLFTLNHCLRRKVK